MDVKDLRIDSGLNSHISDGGIKYAPSGKIPQTERKTFNSNIELQSLGKLDTQVSRPCAIIGPDRVIPPTSTSESYGKHGPDDLWPCPDVYRQYYELPLKMSDFQPSRNISPRQTYQENMQRIMVPPTYSSIKNSDEPSLKNNKNMPPEAKYCDVPFNVNSEHKTVRNSDISVSNVNPQFTRSVPGNGWPGVSVRPLRPYPAPEFYQYSEYSNLPGPRQMPMIRSQRSVHEEPAQVYPERLYQEANLRFKPYPAAKDRYPHTRYEYISSCPNTYPPPPSYPQHKSIQNHSPYPIYPQVPLKYLDRRMPEPIVDGFQRPPNPHVNMNTFRNHIPPPYGPIPSNCYQNKSYPYQSESSKQVQLNKLTYDTNNRVYLDLDNCRSKMYPPDNFYYSDRSQIIRGDIGMAGHTPVNSVAQHQMYRKDNTVLKNYDYASHYRNIDQPHSISNSSLSRLPLQFSPNAIAISPCDSNASNETAQTHGTIQEDCGYVSQSSTTSLKSFDNGVTNDMYRRHDYPNMTSLHSQINNSGLVSKSNISNKKDINVRQFLQMWNEGDEESENNNKEITIQKTNNLSSNSEEQLYVLGLVNVPNEELAKYDHLQKLSKLPENIKGYNYIELLNQYEQIVESPSFNNIHGKGISRNEYPVQTKTVNAKTSKEYLPRPMSPLDVEAKISQSVIHKEVGCNFEIKPCSPKLLNVDIATPVRDIISERLIEKVTNPLMINVKDNIMDSSANSVPPSCNLSNKQYSIEPLKSRNYNLQELETNTSVCLASLPQLDNDIELNFPEVNQQFINSTKTDISNLQQNVTESKIEFNSYTNSSTPSSNTNNEKESSKLSKYRKTKKIDLPTKELELPLSQIHSPSSSIQQRIDSVIIKNPDNTKIHVSDNALLQKNTTIIENITKDNVESENYTFSPNQRSNEEAKAYENLPSETAIDFSLNKTEHNFYRNNYNNTKEDSITDAATYLNKKTEQNTDNHVPIHFNDDTSELKNPGTPDTLKIPENPSSREAVADHELVDYLNKPVSTALSKTENNESCFDQNRLGDENPTNVKQFNSSHIPDSVLEHEIDPEIISGKYSDSITDHTINNFSGTKIESFDDSVSSNRLNDKDLSLTNVVHLVTHKISNDTVSDKSEAFFNKNEDCFTNTAIDHSVDTEEKEIKNSVENSISIIKNETRGEDLNTNQASDVVVQDATVKNIDLDSTNNYIGTPVIKDQIHDALKESDNQIVLRESNNILVANEQELSSILYGKTLHEPKSDEQHSLNDSNILNNLVHNTSTSNCSISEADSDKMLETVSSGGKHSPKSRDKYQNLTENSIVENVEPAQFLLYSNEVKINEESQDAIVNHCNNITKLNIQNTDPDVMINNNNIEKNIQVIKHHIENTLQEQGNETVDTEARSDLSENQHELSCRKTLSDPDPKNIFLLNETNMLKSDLVSNYVINNNDISNEVIHGIVDPVLSENKQSPEMCLNYPSINSTENISVENVVSNEVIHKIVDPVLSENKQSPEMCLNYPSINSTENISVENVESVDYLPQSNDNELTTSSNSLFINSPLNSNNINQEFENKIKDLEFLESNTFEKKTIFAAKETLSDTIFSKEPGASQESTNFKSQIQCDFKQCLEYGDKSKLQENTNLEENQNTLKEDETHMKKNSEIQYKEQILRQNSDTINNLVTILEDVENSKTVAESINNKIKVENTKENLVQKDFAKLLYLTCESSVSTEVVKVQEVLYENMKENNVVRQDETMQSENESKILHDISLNEIELSKNDVDFNIAQQEKLNTCNENEAQEIDSSVKQISEIVIHDKNIDENHKIITTQIDVKPNTCIINVKDTEKCTDDLLVREETTKNELLKMELESELLKNEMGKHAESSSLTEYDQNTNFENSVENKETLPQLKSSFILKNKNGNVQLSKQSKEWHSPWFQKLLLFTEGVCLPQVRDNLPVHNDNPSKFKFKILNDLQNITNSNIKKDHGNAIDILTETKNGAESNLNDSMSAILNNEDVDTVVLNVKSHHDITELDASNRNTPEFSSNDRECIDGPSDVNCIPEVSELTENIPTSNDETDNVKNKEVSPFDDSVIIKRRTLKRSLSESALEEYQENEHKETLFPKRQKLIEANLCNIFQTHRRNSVSEIYNEDSVYILIDESNYVITDDEREKVCYTNIMHIDSHIDANDDSVHTLSENVVHDDYEPCNSPSLVQNVEKTFEETWVDGDCMETMFNDDIAEDIVISAPASPDDSVTSNCDFGKDALQSEEVVEHIEKIKDIYGGNMCNMDAQLVETLYRTPQMNVNKTLINTESPNTELISLKDIISNTEEEVAYENSSVHSEDLITPITDTILSTDNNILLKETYETVNDKEYFEAESISDIDNAIECNENLNTSMNTRKENAINYSITNPHNSTEKTKTFSENNKCSSEYCISSSPEVTSTTSDEKNSSILLKISSSNGSRISQISEDTGNKKISYKLTESNHYKTLNNNYNSAGVLITKAAQKYIPPIKETISNLTVKLPLPQHSLHKLKQLKKSKVEPKINKTLPNSSNLITRHDIVKKQKPKFEDVLMNIDKIQLKKCKEKLKKVKDKEVIPKVVIKKNESGSHYASSSNINTKNKFNPDLTGRKWQPWVFLEKNIFVDKMAIKNKQKAIYCHRKKEFVLAEKFRKYKSVYNANFVISQPKLSDRTKGNLKYTIRLKSK